MQFEADRAHDYIRKAAALLPAKTGVRCRAQIMASIYHALLRQMEQDRFRVSIALYGLSKLAKFLHVGRGC